MSTRRQSSCPLTDTQLEQLLRYAEWAEQDGTYYGDRAQFDRRHAAIMAWIRGEIEDREGRERTRRERQGDQDEIEEVPN